MLVGRDVVVAACSGALTSALAGRGRLILLRGEAGIGKTTIARAIASRADDAGMTTRWGGCWESDSPMPLGVWLDALRRPAGDACAAVAVRIGRGDLDAGDGPAAADRARTRLLGEVVDGLRQASGDRPQLIVLEDLHWAEPASLELLTAVAAQLPAMPGLVVATYRGEEVQPGGRLAALAAHADVVTLDGLGPDHVHALLREVLDRDPTSDEARAVVRQTGGNPLLVTQLGRLLAAGSPASLPSGVRDLLSRRLARVSAECDRVLGAAAVLGTEFDPALVAAVTGATETSVLVALDEAASAGLAIAVEQRAHLWSFAHDLLREARYEALGSNRRAELHRKLADVLEERGAPVATLAHHALRGRFDADDPRPAGLTVAAARDAAARLAWPQAVALATRALETAPQGAAGELVRADAWLVLGDARLRTGASEAAGDAFAAAAANGRRQSRPELVARAALGFGAGPVGFEVRLLDRRQIDLLEEACVALPRDSTLRPAVLARLSVALSFVDDPARRLALADEAVSSSRALGDDRALAAALAARCDVLAGPDHVGERLAAATEVLTLAQRAGDLPLELLGRRLRAVALLERRELTAFDAEVAAYARTADRLRDPLYAWYAPLWRAMRAHADGRLADAARLGVDARDVGVSGGSGNARLLWLIAREFAALDRGDAAEADQVTGEMVAAYPEIVEQGEAATALLALIDTRLGRLGRARARLRRAGAEALDRVPRDQEWLTAVAQLLVVGVVADDRAVVARGYQLLSPYAGLGVFEGAGAVDHGVCDRFLALAAAWLGDAEAARRHAEAALLGNADAGALVLAHTRADCARALLASPDRTDVGRGAQLAHEAAGAFAALGLDRLAAEVGGLVPGGVAAAPGTDSAAALVREGDTWAFTFAGATVRTRHAKGVADLAVLLSRPGREVHVRTLADADAVPAPASFQPALDDTAVQRYRRRLRELEDELDEAAANADAGRTGRLAAERDALVDELTRAFGLGGRARSAGGDPDERLRKAVSARVRATIARLEALHPPLGRHLRNSVRTGFWCSYQPEQPTRWRVSPARSS